MYVRIFIITVVTFGPWFRLSKLCLRFALFLCYSLRFVDQVTRYDERLGPSQRYITVLLTSVVVLVSRDFTNIYKRKVLVWGTEVEWGFFYVTKIRLPFLSRI